MKLRSNRLSFYGIALRIAVPAVAACLAALLAHIAIDVAGDYVLANDAYDATAHGSRWLASLATLGMACVGLWALLRATLAEVRGSYGALRAVLRAALPRNPGAFVALVVVVTAPLVLAMARLDALIAGQAVVDPADLFGGSVALGAGISLAFAIIVALGALRVFRLLLCFHRSLVRAVEAFVRLAPQGESAVHRVASGAEIRPRVPAALVRATGANRAPPIRLTGLLAT